MSRNITVEVLNANEPPHLLVFKDSNGQRKFKADFPVVNETSGLGTVVGTVEVSDPDKGDKITFSLDNNGGGRFSLSQITANCRAETLKVQ